MKIKSALAIFTALTLVVFGAMSFLLMKTSNLLEVEAKSLARAAESIRVSKEIKSHLLIYNRNVFLHAFHRDSARLEPSKIHQAALTNLLETSDQHVDNDEEAAALTEVKEKIANYFKAKNKIQNSDLSSVEKYSQISEKVDVAINAIDKVIEINTLQMREFVKSTSQQNTASDQMVFLLLTVGSLILLGLVTAIIFTVALPLATLSKVISQYNTGKNTSHTKNRGLKEIQEIANNFYSMTDRLEESRNDQLRFIASIAHDLRNPIGALSMASELLIERGDEEAQGLAQVIFRQAKQLNRLVGDLLDTTRIEAGQMEIELSIQDASSVIRDAIELHQVGLNHHKFKIEMTAGPLVCKSDRGRLSQVMNNLISNAVKYSPNGGTVTVKAWEEKNQIIIAVTDQGIGIAQEDLNNIFKPFHRTKATKGTITGIGLGLSASRRIVELHGGQLKVESTLGKGSTFFVVLPSTSLPARNGRDNINSHHPENSSSV